MIAVAENPKRTTGYLSWKPDVCIYDGEKSMLDALNAIDRKLQKYDFENMEDDEFTKTIRELYGPPMNNRRQKEYWKDKVYIRYTDFVDKHTVALYYSDERIVYISDTDWHEHHEELHAMNIEEVIRKYAYEVVSSCI